jgi:hypothetical protein
MQPGPEIPSDGFAGQCSRQRDPLLLPAGERCWILFGYLRQLNAQQQFQRLRASPPAARQRKRDVFPGTQMRKQSIPLRQITHGTMLRQQAAKGFAFGGQQTGEGTQQGGLALAAFVARTWPSLIAKSPGCSIGRHRSCGVPGGYCITPDHPWASVAI